MEILFIWMGYRLGAYFRGTCAHMKTTRPINVTGRPDFRYVPSSKTCLRDTFNRIRREMRDQSVPMSKIVALRANKEK